MELTLPFYELGELRTGELAPSAPLELQDQLRSDALCFLTRGTTESGRVWDYHFVNSAAKLEDPSVIREALNILEGRAYQKDAMALFSPPDLLPESARRALIRTLELGVHLATSTARATLALGEVKLTITTCRVSDVHGEFEI